MTKHIVYGYKAAKHLALPSLLFALSLHCSAAIIDSPERTLVDQSKGTPSPIISAHGRKGAEQFKDLTLNYGVEGMQDLKQRAQQVLATMPNNGLAYEILGTAHFYSKELEQAENAFKHATEFDPNEVGPWSKLGIVQMELSKTAEAEKSLLKAISLNPTHRTSNQRLGLLYEYQGNQLGAIKHLEMGLKDTPADYLGVAVNLGRLMNSVGAFNETIRVLAPRLVHHPKAAEAHAIIARAYIKTDQPAKALQHYSTALNASPDSKEYGLGVAIALDASEQSDKALKTVNQLIESYPTWNVAYLVKADILLKADQFESALKVLEQASKHGAQHQSIDGRLANYFIEKKQFSKAKPHLEKLVKNKAASPKDYASLAEILRSESKVEQALELLQTGLEEHPSSSFLHLRLGSELAATRQYKEALEHLNQANSFTPNNPLTLRTLSLVQAKLGNHQQAAEFARQLYTLKPQASEAAFYAAKLQAANDNEKAVEIYLDILKQDPKNVLAHNNIATAYRDLNQLDQAETHAVKANELLPNNEHLLDTLGWILYLKQQYAEAEKNLEKAVSLAPDNANILYHYGLAAFKNNNLETAKKTLSEAINLSPESSWESTARETLSTF